MITNSTVYFHFRSHIISSTNPPRNFSAFHSTSLRAKNWMDMLQNFCLSSQRKFRGTFNGLFALVLVVLLLHQEGIFQTPIYSNFLANTSPSHIDTNGFSLPKRRVIQENNVTTYNLDPVVIGILKTNLYVDRNPVICPGIYEQEGYNSKCQYLRVNPKCHPGGFFNYFKFLYCDCENYRAFGYVVLAVWLVALFYLLGNTAADYFCCCLEKLSNLLKLPPTVAGVTLLPLGNGAPDVFASIAAFTSRDAGDVGLNSVLGGAVFVTCVVVGTISLCIAEKDIHVDKKCFIRDVCFFLAALLSLLIILIVGEVTIGGAVAFLSIYVIYALSVAAKEIGGKYSSKMKLGSFRPLLPLRRDARTVAIREHESIQYPLIESNSADEVPHLQEKLPHWMWASNVAIYSNEALVASSEDDDKILWGWNEKESVNEQSSCSCAKFCYMLEYPLTLPRRLTIPIVDEKRWSKVYAVASASLAPILLALLLNALADTGPLAKEITFIGASIVGGMLGVLTFLYTKTGHPPQRFLLVWVVGGFVMSIVWFYIIASELVALLVSYGVIFGINPSLLALTVLAWGNSMGDLMSNVAMAMNGRDGVQIAISGCYAGPMFNTLAGLGISLLIGACSKRPASYILPRDSSLYLTLVFLISGLLWSLIVLPWNSMRPNKLLGMGLMTIYMAFLTSRACFAVADQPLNV